LTSSFKKNIINGTLWSVGGQLASLLILLITNIWLVRLLSPNEFGQAGIVMFFIILANVLTDGGFSGALIRKNNATQNDYSTIFVFNLTVSISCFLLLLLCSGWISDFYNDLELKPLLITSGLVLIINSFQITQNVRMINDMKFKQKSLYRLIAVSIASVIGIISAYQGAGVWSLVTIQLVTASITTLLLWKSEGFFLKLHFHKESFKELYRFGVYTTLASLLDTVFNNIYQLILGKYFSISQTGIFYQAKKLDEVPSSITNMITQSVIFSSLAKLQDDKVAFSNTYNKITLYFSVTLALFSCIIYLYAEPIILLIYGKKWIEAAFYMQLLTIASFFYLQEMFNRVIFKVFNKTKQILYLELIKKCIQIISIIIGIVVLDIKILLLGFVFTHLINYIINYYFSRKILESRNNYELRVIYKIAFLALFIVLFMTKLFQITNTKGYLTLVYTPILFIIYFGLLKIMKIFDVVEELKTTKNIILKKLLTNPTTI
jgi:teichuronic acid exporter